MTGPTKMIIITSDEDVIRQFSFNKNKSTHIIDLGNNTEMTSRTEDINSNFIAQLSQLNSNNDQVYKRALDSTDHNRTKSVKAQKKSIDMICAICGDRAIGYNYDVLSCGSCKIFFRRNVYLDSDKVHCLTGQGQCSVAHDTRRKCKKCRLDRCLAAGMRKDFLRSEEENERRKKRGKVDRNTSLNGISNPHTAEEIDHESMNMDEDEDHDIIAIDEITNSNEITDTLFEILSVEDWLTIQSVRSSFLSVFENDNVKCTCVDISDRTSALISWSHFLDRVALRFINFFRQIIEFEDLNLDDRFILIKYNISSVSVISKCFHYASTNDCCSGDYNEAAERSRRFFLLCGDANGIRDAFINNVRLLVDLSEQDSTFLSLFSLILIFSQGLSMNENESILKDPLAVNRAQCYYTKVFWNYLVNKCGEIEACKRFTKLLTLIFRIQSASKNYRDFFRAQYMTSDALDRIAPIMQSVLHIS